MYLIASGAYCDQEFLSEFGYIPPSFLPVGNRRLYQHQVEQLKRAGADRVYLSIPETYKVRLADKKLIESLGLDLIMVPEGMNLGESVSYCINVTGGHAEEVRILYGDTLLYEHEFQIQDHVSGAEVEDNYSWHFIGENSFDFQEVEPYGMVLSGYFSFSNGSKLVECIARSRGDFVEAVYEYSKSYKKLKVITNDSWLDFGHIHTYFRSKAKLTTQRGFNYMNISPIVVEKLSQNSLKMKAETNWFLNIPENLRIYTPRFISEVKKFDVSGYKLEYLYLNALNELFVFGELPLFVWRRIFDACGEFITECSSAVFDDFDLDLGLYEGLYLKKTLARLKQYSLESDVDVNSDWLINDKLMPSLYDLATISGNAISPVSNADIGVIHGDFCFSNVLYDFRTQSVRVVDPRGIDPTGSINFLGDKRYDIAKMAHSVIGYYDHIIAGHYELSSNSKYELNFYIDDERVLVIKEILMESQFVLNMNNKNELYPMMIQLFISMLPLHSDRPDRQKAFIANAYRLYEIWNGIK